MYLFHVLDAMQANGKVPQELEGAFHALKEAARKVATTENSCKLEVDVDEYVASFKPDLMEVVIAWSQGATFAHIMKLAGVFEVRK